MSTSPSGAPAWETLVTGTFVEDTLVNNRSSGDVSAGNRTFKDTSAEVFLPLSDQELLGQWN